MVAPRAGLLGRAAQAVRDDLTRLGLRLRALSATPAFRPGLYHLLYQEGAARCHLHLRLHPDGTGLLFVDAVQALHLTPPQAAAARLLLRGDAASPARHRLAVAFPRASRERLARDLAAVGRLLASARSGREDCLACAAELPQPPPFAISPRAPYKADLALTYDCQNRCSHCYNEPGRRELPGLTTAQWRAALRRLWEIGVPYVIFTGGEPTLHPDLPELVAHAHELGFVTGMNTNGRRLAAPGYAEALAAAGLDHVQITLHSLRAEVHDRMVGAPAFAETIAGLCRARECGLHALTNTTLTRTNAAEAPELVEFLAELGVPTFAMNGMIHAGCGKGHGDTLSAEELAPLLERVRDLARRHGMRFLWYTPTRYCRLHPVELGLGVRCCNAAEYSCCVEPNGDVLPCQSYYQAVGNLLRDPWPALWDSELFRRLRLRREDPRGCGLPERCWECADLSLCGGGCALERSLEKEMTAA